MRGRFAFIACVALLLGAGCGKGFVLDPPHDSPRDPDNPLAGPPPPRPGSLTVESVEANAITLRWTMSDSSGVGSYRIQARGPADADFVDRATTPIQRGTVSGLQTGGSYAFRVVAVTPAGLRGPASEAVLAQPATIALLINNNDEFTRDETVTVTTTGVGFDQIRLGESPGSLSGYRNLDGAGASDFTFAGADGVRTLYGQLRVAATGAESPVLSDAIRLDRVAAIESVSWTGTPTPGAAVRFQLDANETDGQAAVDIGTSRTGIVLRDDGSGGDPVAGDGIYEALYTVETTFDANAAPVVGRFTDRAGNQAPPAQAAAFITIVNPPPAVTLLAAVPQGGGRVLLQWTQSGAGDFFAYRIWHAPTSPVLSSPGRALDSTMTARSATILVTDSLAVGVAQRFVVEVVDLAGNASGSNEVAATPTAAAVALPRAPGSAASPSGVADPRARRTPPRSVAR
jgi:hypothetical protein